jgi:hypothetical protein
MKRRTFILTIEHDDSLFPDEGALRNAVERVLYTKHAWFTADRPGVMAVALTEGHVVKEGWIIPNEVTP